MPTKVCIVKPMVFPIVLYRCESWTLKKAECWRIDAFKLWCWRRFLIVPWTARRSNLSILNKITPEYALEGLMLKPDWPPDLKSQLIGNDPDAVKDWRQEKGTTENKKVAWLTDSTDMSLSKLQDIVEDGETWCAADHGVSKSRPRLTQQKPMNCDLLHVQYLENHMLQMFIC